MNCYWSEISKIRGLRVRFRSRDPKWDMNSSPPKALCAPPYALSYRNFHLYAVKYCGIYINDQTITNSGAVQH